MGAGSLWKRRNWSVRTLRSGASTTRWRYCHALFPARSNSQRERMVLAFLVKGASSKEAARDLGISPRTVEFHRANIIDKLGARNTAELIRYAARHGLMD